MHKATPIPRLIYLRFTYNYFTNENAGHAVHQECKDFNQRVYEFLRE